LPPFVVGENGGGDDQNSQQADKNLHGVSRIAR
jgi:hypothetical protein